jgi:cytochrome c oxidase subunit 1
MPRRIPEYSPTAGWTFLNRLSTAGSYLLFISVAITIVNMWVSWRKPVLSGDNPWDAQTLEWATSSPPPHHNFYWIPPIRSERPLWDYNHPDHTGLDGHGGNGHGAPAREPATVGSSTVRIIEPPSDPAGTSGNEADS